MLLTTALLSWTILAPTSSPTSDALGELRDLRRQVQVAFLEDRVATGFQTGAVGIRMAAQALSESDSDEAGPLADEIELALIELDRAAASLSIRPKLRGLLEGVEIAPEHGAAYSRLQWLREDRNQSLKLLTTWEIIGPFENERGVGFETSLPPQENPASGLSHPGKVREVDWRPLPETPPAGGVIRLRELVDPAQQACVLARSWIASEDADPILLLLGAGEEVRVYWNGEPVFEALQPHRFRADAFAIELSPRPGWNELGLVVGSRDETPRFIARLVDPRTGTPLDREQLASAPDGLTPSPWQTTSAGARIDETGDRPGIWRRVAGDDSAEGHYRRSVLEAFFQPEPRHENPGRASARQAVEREPREPLYLVQHTRTLREDTRVSAERDVNPWLHSIDRLLEVAPEAPAALRWKASHAYQNQPTYDRALDLLERALTVNPNSLPAAAMRIEVYNRLQQSPLAALHRRRFLAHPEADFFPRQLLEYASALPSKDGSRSEIYSRAIAASESLDARWDQATRERAQTDDSSADTILALARELLAKRPWSVAIRIDVAHLLLAASHSQDALLILDEALELAPERAALHRLRARALLALEDLEGAVAALEGLLEVDYSATDDRRLLEHLRTLGGEPFHTPFLEDLDQVLTRMEAAAPIEAGEVSREVLLQRVVVAVNPDATAKRYYRLVQKIRSESGAQALDRVPFHAYPGDQEARVLTANVRRSDGTLLRARTGRGGRRGGLWVDLPPLEVGDIVDLEWRVDDLRPTFFGQYFGFRESLTPDALVPVYESEIVFLVPEELPLRFHTRNFTGERETGNAENGLVRHDFRLDRIAPLRRERNMPPLEEHAPIVQASSYASWDEFGRWWWNLIESEIRVSPEMAAKVQELIRGSETRLEKLRAIYDFVVTDIRYNAWEFGVHGYQPYSAPVIFSRGFGDCKDKAILLRALLSEIEIEAYPVLIRAEDRRPDEDQTLALVEHFNHCIAYIPEQEGLEPMYLDGTARHHPLEVLPEMDNGADVLIVRPDGVEQKTIPFASAQANRIDHVYEVRLGADRGAQVAYSRSSKGRFDPAERRRFAGSQEEREEEAQRMLAGIFGPIAGTSASEFSELEDLSEPVESSFQVQPERIARTAPDGFELPVVFHRYEFLVRLAQETERTTDLLMNVPWSATTQIDYVLAAGQSPTRLPEAVEVETEDARYSFQAEPIENGVRLREEFELKTGRIPPDRYAAFRELCRQVDSTQAATIGVEVKP